MSQVSSALSIERTGVGIPAAEEISELAGVSGEAPAVGRNGAGKGAQTSDLGKAQGKVGRPGVAEQLRRKEDEAWGEWVSRQWQEGDVGALGISILLHVMLFALLYVTIRATSKDEIGVSTVATNGDEEAVLDLDADLANQVKMPELKADPALNPAHGLVQVSESELVNADALLSAPSKTEATGEEGGGIGEIGKLVAPRNAVRAGSFTAWTIPIPTHPDEEVKPGQRPRVRQHYYIVVQIKVPVGRKEYPLTDLTGSVKGTDGYLYRFPPFQEFTPAGRIWTAQSLKKKLKVVDGVAQVKIAVKGTQWDAPVEDTITVKSKMLKEERELKLVFDDGESN